MNLEKLLISFFLFKQRYFDKKPSFNPSFGFTQVKQASTWLFQQKYDVITECFHSLNSDQKTALVEGLCMTEKFAHPIQMWVEKQPSNALSHLFNGALFTHKAWVSRTGLRAKYVTQKQANGFFQNLELAYEYLQTAIKLDASEAESYARTIRVLMGFSQPIELLYEYFHALQEIEPQHLYGHMYMLNALSEKWLGSNEQMMEFVEQVKPNIPNGSLLHLLTPMAHVEVWLNHHKENIENNYFRRDYVQQSIYKAYQLWIEGETTTSVLEPILHNYFCFVFYWMGNHSLAENERKSFGEYMSFYPWGYESIFHLKEVDKYLSKVHSISNLTIQQ